MAELDHPFINKLIQKLFPDIPHIQSECGEYPGILRETLSVPHDIVMDLYNVMRGNLYVLDNHYGGHEG